MNLVTFLSIQLLLHFLVRDVQEVLDWILLFRDMISLRVHMDMILTRSIKNGCMNKIYLLSSDTSTLDEISKSAGHKLVKKDGKYVKETDIH